MSNCLYVRKIQPTCRQHVGPTRHFADIGLSGRQKSATCRQRHVADIADMSSRHDMSSVLGCQPRLYIPLGNTRIPRKSGKLPPKSGERQFPKRGFPHRGILDDSLIGSRMDNSWMLPLLWIVGTYTYKSWRSALQSGTPTMAKTPLIETA